MKSCLPIFFIGLMCWFCSCSKEATIIERSERYPLDKVPAALLNRASAFALNNSIAIDFLKGDGDTYMLRFVILRRSEKMPSKEEMDKIRAGEIKSLSSRAYDEIFLKQPTESYNCSLVIFVIYYNDNSANFFFQ